MTGFGSPCQHIAPPTLTPKVEKLSCNTSLSTNVSLLEGVPIFYHHFWIILWPDCHFNIKCQILQYYPLQSTNLQNIYISLELISPANYKAILLCIVKKSGTKEQNPFIKTLSNENSGRTPEGYKHCCTVHKCILYVLECNRRCVVKDGLQHQQAMFPCHLEGNKMSAIFNIFCINSLERILNDFVRDCLWLLLVLMQ